MPSAPPRRAARRDTRANRVEHRLGAAGEHVPGVLGDELGDEPRLDDHLSAREQASRLRVPIAAKPEDRRRSAEHVREVGHRRDADAARHEQRPLDGEIESVPERAENVDRLPPLERTECACARADRIEEECELAVRRLTQAHRARQNPPGSLQHEELTGDPGVERAAIEPDEHVRTDRLRPDDGQQLPPGITSAE